MKQEDIPLKTLFIRDIELSKAVAKLAGLRQESEDINSFSVSFAYHKRFLKAVNKGMTYKPDLGNHLDNAGMIEEIKNPYNKNIDLILSQIEGMTKDGEAPVEMLEKILNL